MYINYVSSHETVTRALVAGGPIKALLLTYIYVSLRYIYFKADLMCVCMYVCNCMHIVVSRYGVV